MTLTEKIFGIVCVVLLAVLVGSLSYYIPTTIRKDDTISSLNAQLSSETSQVGQNYYTVHDLQDQVNNLTRTLNATLNLSKSIYLVRDHGINLWDKFEPVYEGKVPYAGYIVVQISTEWENNTLEVSYSFDGYNFYEKRNFSQSITATFPVLPSSNLKVVAFTEAFVLTGPADASVTITLYY